MPSVEIKKKDIRQLSKEELIAVFVEYGESKFRGKQVYEWLWKNGAHSFEQMTNLSKKLRAFLSEHFCILPITTDLLQQSNDGTIKTRFRLHDGHLIESVLIPVPDQNRFTVCISSQVGCSLSCKFCATGQMKRLRNLDASEIYDQVLIVNKQCEEVFGHPLTNVVYMGMGEPLLAYKPVLRSIELLTSKEGMNMAPRRITVSTAGISKMIRKLADDGVRVNLALSLHAADDEKRNEIMPINETNNLEVLIDSLNYFYEQTKDSKLTFEYIAFDNFNIGMDDAQKLLKLCRRLPKVKINVIEYNKVEGVTFNRAANQDVNKFAEYLRKNKVNITVRRSRGKDIDAACGQLANKE